MARLYVIRHGLADKGWSEDKDPPLAARGKEQAQARAKQMSEAHPKMKIISSPLLRCQETAQPLTKLWQTEPEIINAVSEIPTPKRLTLKDRTLLDRAKWLRSLLEKNWSDLSNEASLLLWKKHLLDWSFHCEEDCVVFSHFIAINTLVGAAIGDDSFISHQPNHCSCWVFDNSAGLALTEKGEELETKVL